MSVFCLSKGRVFPSLSEEYIEYGQSDDLMCLLVTSSLVPFWWDGRYGDLHDRSVLKILEKMIFCRPGKLSA